MRHRRLDGGVGVDDGGRRQEAVEQAIDLGGACPYVCPHRLPNRWRRGTSGAGGQRQHRGAEPALAQGVEGLDGPLDVLHDDCVERLAGRRSEGGLIALVDLDQVEQRAQDSFDCRQVGHAGTRAGLVERQGEGLGPCPRGADVGLRRSQPLPCGVALHGGGVHALFDLRERLDQRLFGRLALGQLATQVGGRDVEAFDLGLKKGKAAGETVTLCRGLCERRPKHAQLAARLGGADTEGHEPVRPGDLEGGAVGRQSGLGQRQSLRLGGQGLGFGFEACQLRLGPGLVGFETEDHLLRDEGLAVALDATEALDQHAAEPAAALAEGLVAEQAVAEVVSAGGQLHLCDADLVGEPLEDGARPGLDPGQLGSEGSLLPRPSTERCEFGGRAMAPQRTQLADQVTVPTGRLGLTLERSQLSPYLALQIAQTVEVHLGRTEAPFGLLAALAVLQDPRSVLDDHASVLGLCVQHGVDLALRDDHVLLTAHRCVGKQFLDVEQPTGRAVQRIFALTGTEQRAGDGDLGEVDRQQTRVVVDRERDLGPVEGGPLGGAGEDDVVHLL